MLKYWCKKKHSLVPDKKAEEECKECDKLLVLVEVHTDEGMELHYLPVCSFKKSN
jgi:hypothetical protein